MAQDTTSLPAGQPRLGVPEVRPIDADARSNWLCRQGLQQGLQQGHVFCFIRTSGVSTAFIKRLSEYDMVARAHSIVGTDSYCHHEVPMIL